MNFPLLHRDIYARAGEKRENGKNSTLSRGHDFDSRPDDRSLPPQSRRCQAKDWMSFGRRVPPWLNFGSAPLCPEQRHLLSSRVLGN